MWATTTARLRAPLTSCSKPGMMYFLTLKCREQCRCGSAGAMRCWSFWPAPSFAELERRLQGRGDTAPELIQKRLETAHREYQFADRYDYIVISDLVEKTAEELNAILTAEQCRAKLRLAQLKEE